MIVKESRDIAGSTRANLDVILEKLKLLEFGLYGLHQYGRSAGLDVDDLGPFYRLAEEIASDVLALQQRLASGALPEPSTDTARATQPSTVEER